MYTSPPNGVLRLDSLDQRQIERLLEKSQRGQQEEAHGDDDGRLCCAACRRPITREKERVQIRGRHQHVLSNPHGLTFRIGCFATASGCVYVGEATEKWTWFPGYRWQIAVCGGCGVHLGWRYQARDATGFHGFILRRLAPDERGGPPS
jgi:hypothetical protein